MFDARDLVVEPDGDAPGVLERLFEAALHAEALVLARLAGAGQLGQDGLAGNP